MHSLYWRPGPRKIGQKNDTPTCDALLSEPQTQNE